MVGLPFCLVEKICDKMLIAKEEPIFSFCTKGNMRVLAGIDGAVLAHEAPAVVVSVGSNGGAARSASEMASTRSAPLRKLL